MIVRSRSSTLTVSILFVMALALYTFAGAGRAAEKKLYAGTNVFSPEAAMLPVPGSTLFSVLSNLECGFGISVGIIRQEIHAFEARLAIGPSSSAETIFNAQIYYNFYLMRKLGWRGRGLYAGSGIRYWDLYNEMTDIHRSNFAHEFDVGYRFNLPKSLFLDLRMNEITIVYTTTSDAHILGGWSSIFSPSLPKVPLVSLDFGVRF